MPRLLMQLLAVVVCVLGLWTGIPAGTGHVLAQNTIRDNVRVTVLDNELTVILAPKAGAPVATVNVWIGVGSVHEPPQLNGIAHFFEHMIFKGSPQYPGNVFAAIEGLGGSANASTSLDWTQYYISLPSEHVSAAIELWADLLINGLFTAEEMLRERDVILREGQQRDDNPDNYLAAEVWRAFYGDHPYGKPILGTGETVSGITREDFLAWLDTYYVPNNMIVVVAGDIDPDEALQQVKTHFGIMEPRPLPHLEPAAPAPRTAVEQLYLTRDTEQERLSMAFPGPAIDDLDDTVAMDVLLYVLSGGRSSRLYRNVVRDLGIVTDADAWYFTTRYPGILGLSAQYPPVQATLVRNALLHEVERILDGDLTQAEVETARRVLIAGMERDFERSRDLSFSLGFSGLLTGDPLYIFKYMDSIRAVTVEDVVAVTRKYAQPGTQLEVRLGPGPAMDQGMDRDRLLTLDNGLRLLLQEDEASQIVAFQTFVGTGTSVETAEQAGISAFTNSFLLRGTETRSEEEIFAATENLGATLSQSQLPDMASLSLVATADTWSDALPIYLDVLMNPAFAEEEFQRLQNDILLQIEAEQSSLFTVIYNQLLQSLYGDSGYGNPELGTVDSITALTVDAIKDFHARHYVPGNMIISVVGNMDASLMAAYLTTALQGLESTGAPVEHGARHSRLETSETVQIERSDANLVWLVMGFPGPAVSSEDYAAMKVLNSIIGDGASSRLFATLRGQQGLVYSTGSFFPSRAGHSHLALYAIAAPEYREATVEAILAIVQDIADNGVADEELDLAVRREVGNYVLRRETAEQRAFDRGWYEMLGAGYTLSDKYPDRLRAVTTDDLQRVAAQYLQHYAVSVLSPPE